MSVQTAWRALTSCELLFCKRRLVHCDCTSTAVAPSPMPPLRLSPWRLAPHRVRVSASVTRLFLFRCGSVLLVARFTELKEGPTSVYPSTCVLSLGHQNIWKLPGIARIRGSVSCALQHLCVRSLFSSTVHSYQVVVKFNVRYALQLSLFPVQLCSASGQWGLWVGHAQTKEKWTMITSLPQSEAWCRLSGGCGAGAPLLSFLHAIERLNTCHTP